MTTCPHCGRPIAAIASEHEQRMIAELAGVKGWNSRADDLGYIRGLGLEYGLTEKELLGVVKDMAAWLADRPREKGGRNRLRNFCKTAAKGRETFPVAAPQETDAQRQAKRLGWQVGQRLFVAGEYVGTYDGAEVVPPDA